MNQSGDYITARAKVETLHRADWLNEGNIYEYAKARWFEETVTALALMCGCRST